MRTQSQWTSACVISLLISTVGIQQPKSVWAQCVEPPSGLVGWWPGDGNARDLLGVSDGTLINGATFASGLITSGNGQALSLDGFDDYMALPQLPVSGLLQSTFTIEFWASPQSSADRPTFGFVGSGQSNVSNPLTSYDSWLSFGNEGSFQLLQPLPNAATGAWTHYAIVDDGSSYIVYVNGAQVEAVTIGLAPASTADRKFVIGQSGFTGQFADHFNGLIDEFAIYSRGLLASEIQDIYLAGSEGKCKPVCGDGIVEAGEPCDDSNTLSEDGCSETCTVESGFGCSGTPSVCNPIPCVPKAANMVGWWSGDGHALDLHDSHNGTLQGGAGFTTGHITSAGGQAFVFDGIDDYVEIPDSPELRITGTVTIEFWAKRQRLSPADIVVEKGGDWTGGQANYIVGLHGDPGLNHMFHFAFNGGWRGTSGVTDFDWHHYAVVATNGATAPLFYLDGTPRPLEFSGGASVMSLAASTRPLHIGAQVEPVFNYYGNAIIDELGIYDGGLSASEIQAIFTASTAGKCKAVCGDGIVGSIEECDDGNTISGDGCSATCEQDIWFVNDDGATAAGCTSWSDACPDLQTALSFAASDDQVWVAAGTYNPDAGTGNRLATFQLIDGVALYGGFFGDETSLPSRVGLFDDTILSGDLNSDDGTAGNGENSFHVVKGTATNATAILDGFTITAGNANGGASENSFGAGMENSGGSPTVKNCTFTGNSALQGGGMANMFRSTGNFGVGVRSAPLITDCTFSVNSAGDGAGMLNTSSDPTIIGCTFTENTVVGGGRGGAMSTVGGSPTIVDCEFLNNSVPFGGGGGIAHDTDTDLTLTDCIFSGNSAGSPGGALSVGGTSISVTNTELVRCAFSGNSAPSGGAVSFGFTNLTLTNCTLTGNTATTGFGGAVHDGSNNPPGASLTMANCVLSGNSAGAGGAAATGAVNVSSASMIDCTFSGNSAGGNGGAIFNNAGTLSATGCIFDHNSVSKPGGPDAGGGALHGGGAISLTDCTFVGNSADDPGSVGAAVSASGAAPLTMTNCLVCNNSASGSFTKGGGIFIGALNSPTLTNCTIAGNIAASGAGIAIGTDVTGSMINSIVWGNSGSSQVFVDPFSVLTVSHSIVQGGWPGPGANNIDADPLFADLSNCDVHILPGSPATDAGDSAAPDLPPNDLDGRDRIFGLAPDLGAFELDVVDITPPLLTIDSVTSPTGAPTQLIMGTVSDPVVEGVSSGVAGVTINGAPADVSGGTYSGSVGLNQCLNDITVVAADNAGNQSMEMTEILFAFDEVCDGQDNDCDEIIDNELGATTCGLGECQVTVQNCVDGNPQNCVPGDPITELCDGLDNDCEGTIDNGLGTTTCGLGVCTHTIDNCVDGAQQSCDPFEGATVEVCDGSDSDCDGIIDNAAIEIHAARHTVGSGAHPGSSKDPFNGITICAYDKSDGSCARDLCGGISHQHYECIALGEDTDGNGGIDVGPCESVNCCVTDEFGECTIDLPPGDYIVISADATKTVLPDPLGVSASDLLCGELKRKHLQQIVKANGKKVPGKTTRLTGSELLIIEPEFVLWDETEQLYPFVFESIGDWGVTASVSPPEGFIADWEELSAYVDNALEAVQFTITEVGSDLVPTVTTFQIQHKGQSTTVQSAVDIRLTADYAQSRGFDVAALRVQGLIKKRQRSIGHGRGEGYGHGGPSRD